MEAALEPGLVGDANFWYKLKVDYETVADGPDRLKNLVLEFFKGRKASVQEKFKEPMSYVESISTLPEKAVRETLFSIYINHVWNQSKTGHNFKPLDGRELDDALKDVFTVDPLDIRNEAHLQKVNDAVGSPGAQVLFKVFCAAGKALAKVKQDAGIFVREKDFVASNLIYSTVEGNSGWQVLVKDGRLFIKLSQRFGKLSPPSLDFFPRFT